MSISASLSQITLLLHAKQIIQGALGLQLPHMSGATPQGEDATSWWDFVSVDALLSHDEAHPDLVANLRDGSQLFIEIAIKSFVNAEKLERIEAVGVKTIEIDLSDVCLSLPDMPPEELKELILHRADIKRWIYPDYTHLFVSPKVGRSESADG
jgi:competence protein CoiA